MKNFKEVFLFDNMTDMREEIIFRCQRERWACANEYRISELLTTSKWGQIMVCGPNGRLEEYGFHDLWDIKGNVPTKKEIKEVYDAVIESGARSFTIHFDVMVRAWDDFPHKFSGACAEPTDNYADIMLIEHRPQVMECLVEGVKKLTGKRVAKTLTSRRYKIHDEANGYCFQDEAGEWIVIPFKELNLASGLGCVLEPLNQ